jgi:hypothetical protein
MASRASSAKDRNEAGAERPDYFGYVLFAIPPCVAALRYLGFPLNQFVFIPLFLALTIFADASRWNLPRWLWVPLMVLWPVMLPGYGFIRRFDGARAHWSLGLASVGTWYALFARMFEEGRAP